MKRMLFVVLAMFLAVSLGACQSGIVADVEHTIGFYNLFGETTELIRKNIDFGNTEGVINGKETTYTFPCMKNDEGFVKKELVFYNDILMSEKTYFSDVGKAYNFAKGYRETFEANYGEKDTYPEITLKNADFFDDISGVESLKENCVYYEDYTVTVADQTTERPWLNKEKAEKMLDGRQFSRIDLRLELTVHAKDAASVSVRYIVVP